MTAPQEVDLNLLDISRIVTGKLLLDVENVDLAALIDSSIESVRHSANERLP